MFCVVDLRGIEIDFEYTLDGAKPPLELFNPIGICNPIVTKIESPKTVLRGGVPFVSRHPGGTWSGPTGSAVNTRTLREIHMSSSAMDY